MNVTQLNRLEWVTDECLRMLTVDKMNPGDPFPSAQMISIKLQVELALAKQGIQELCNRGVLVQTSDMVLVAPCKIPRKLWIMNSLSTAMESVSVRLSSHMISFDICEAAKEEATALSLHLGTKLYRLYRVRYIDDEPLFLEVSYLPVTRLQGLMEYDFGKLSLYNILKSYYNVVPKTQELEFSLDLPTVNEQALLKISPNEPLLVQFGYTVDQNGNRIEYSVSKAVGRRFSFESYPKL